jgi:hypothetical protein
MVPAWLRPIRAPKRHSPGLRRRSGQLRLSAFQAVAPSKEMTVTSPLDRQLQACRRRPEQNPRLEKAGLKPSGPAAPDAPPPRLPTGRGAPPSPMGMPSQRSVSATALLLSRIRALPITGGYDAPVPGAAAQIIKSDSARGTKGCCLLLADAAVAEAGSESLQAGIRVWRYRRFRPHQAPLVPGAR